jgi:hypothetical protein
LDCADPGPGRPLLAFWPSQFHYPGTPDIPRSVSGPNSLSPEAEAITSRVLTLYAGFRLRNNLGAGVARMTERMWNPGYNRARGPILVGAVRLHFEGALFPR